MQDTAMQDTAMPCPTDITNHRRDTALPCPNVLVAKKLAKVLYQHLYLFTKI